MGKLKTSSGRVGLTPAPKPIPALGLELGQLLAVDLAHARRRDRPGRIDLLGLQARRVLVQMLADQPGLLVVGSDERLSAGHVIEGLGTVGVVTDRAQI